MADTKAVPVVVSRPRRPALPRLDRLVVPAALTLTLCCLAFGLWQWRANVALREEADNLRTQRMGLIENIRESNREIAELREQASQTTAPTRPTATIPAASGLRAAPALAVTSFGLPPSFNNGSVDKKLVAITFDGGSYANAAQEILDTLRSRNVKATMFLTGEFMRKYPDVVRAIVADAHEVGNHLYSHPHLTSWEQDQTQTTLSSVTPQMIARELDNTNTAFRKLTGADLPPIWRAPYGEQNRQVCLWAQVAGWLHIGWRQGRTWRQNLDSNDWIPNEESPGYHAPEEVLDKIMSMADEQPGGINGGIILMHLGTARKSSDQYVHRFLGTLIDRLTERGYRFVTVGEMLGASGVDPMVLRRQPEPTAAQSASDATPPASN
jgi:peptidoglycan/xylan/chitin deacetylase (PgdA/CDA1 family)